MKRLLMVMVLAVVGTAQAPEFTNGELNGLQRLKMNSTEKALVAAEAGFMDAQTEISMALEKAGVRDPVCSRNIEDTYRDKVAKAKRPREDQIREIDAFYNVGGTLAFRGRMHFCLAI